VLLSFRRYLQLQRSSMGSFTKKEQGGGLPLGGVDIVPAQPKAAERLHGVLHGCGVLTLTIAY